MLHIVVSAWCNYFFRQNPDAIYIRNWNQRTPVLLVGDRVGCASMLSYFLQVAPDTVEHTYDDGSTLLHSVANIDIAKTIFKLKPQLIDVVDCQGNTPLHHATCRDVALCLLECKPSLVYVKNSDGQTPLHYAESDVARAILRFKPDLVDTDEHGCTVLHVAIKHV